MALQLTDFNYELPSELIAQAPAVPRDSSRLLVFDRQKGVVENSEGHFFDLPTILANKIKNEGRELLLVRNNSAVIPARLFGMKPETGSRVEILLARQKELGTQTETWECLTKPGLKVGQKISFQNDNFSATCTEISGYTRLLKFDFSAQIAGQKYTFYDHLNELGCTPLPPYIDSQEPEQSLRQLYQTIYAQEAGSVAAPTAGLHFTPQVDQALRAAGIEIAEVTLHVGLGTFLGVKTSDITEHQMHAEQFTLGAAPAQIINQYRARGGAILAIGTTTTRVLETCFDSQKQALVPQSGDTSIFLYPPQKFQVVDHLLTNFHLPKSTLLMLISALTSTPNTPHEFQDFLSSPIGQAYATAIREKFRFFSFGDSMLIW